MIFIHLSLYLSLLEVTTALGPNEYSITPHFKKVYTEIMELIPTYICHSEGKKSYYSFVSNMHIYLFKDKNMQLQDKNV